MISNFDAYLRLYKWAREHNLTITINDQNIVYRFDNLEFMISSLKNKQLDLILDNLSNNQNYTYKVNSKTIDLILKLLDDRYFRYINLFEKDDGKHLADYYKNSYDKDYANENNQSLVEKELISLINSLREHSLNSNNYNQDKTIDIFDEQTDIAIMKSDENIDTLYSYQEHEFELISRQAVTIIYTNNLEDSPIELYLKCSVRLINSLKSARIFTFKDLFKLSPFEISKIRNLGNKSFRELYKNLSDLSEQLNTKTLAQLYSIEVQIDTPTYFNLYLAKIRELYGDETGFRKKKINEYALSTRVTNSLFRAKVYTIDILTTKDWTFFSHLKNFGSKSFTELRNFLYKHFVVKMDNDDILIKNQSPSYLINYDFVHSIDEENAHYSFSQMVQDNTYDKMMDYDIEVVGDLISIDENHQIYQDRFVCNDYELYSILKVLTTPLEIQINLEFTQIINTLKPNHRDILLMRLQGFTLEKIGQKYQITRERVRQICVKIARKAKESIQYKNILKYLRIISDGVMYCTKTHLERILDDKIEPFIWFFEALFDYELDVLFLNVSAKKEILQEIEILDNVINLKYFQENYHFLKHFEVVKTYVRKKYHVLQMYAFKNKPTYVELYTIVLKDKFEYMRISDESELNRFREYYFELFGDKGIFNKTSRSITAILQRLPGIDMRGRGEYHFMETKLNDELVLRLKNTIKENKSISFRGLLGIYKAELIKYEITNQFQLHSIIKKNIPDLYTNRDYVSISNIVSIDINTSVSNFIKKQTSAFSFSDIRKAIPDITELLLSNHIEESREAITIYNKKYLPSFLLKLEDSDKLQLSNVINHCLDNDGIITSQRLYIEILGEQFGHVIKQNSIDNAHFSYKFVRYFFGNEYMFEHNCIFYYDQPAMTQLEFLIQKFLVYNKISIKELVDFSNRHFITVQNMKALLDTFYNRGYMRLDEDLIIKTKYLQFPASFIYQIESLIEESLVGDILSTDEIETYDNFPKISINWNKHIFAHLIKNYGDKFYVIDVGNQYNSLSYQFKEKENE